MLKLVSVILLLSSVVAETRPRLGSDGDTLLDGLKNEAINYRLSEKVIPESYVLELTTHLKKGNVTDKNFFKYEGSVKIKLKVESKQDNIILHSRNLTIESIVVMEPYIKDGINHRLDTERDFLIISRKDGQPLEVGKYELRINFESELGSDMRGFYRSSYKRDNGAIQWLATTHFEPVGARRAFPCFDEPKFKATFDISITHDNQLRAVSNTPFLEKTNITGTNNTKTTFKQTPKMSTYLVALLVSDFKNRQHQNNTRFGVLTRENAIENSDLAVTTGEKLLKALEDYTGIPYFRDTENATKLTLSMDKMDQAAIPDFRAGAMENWGLVLYKEGSLLYNENKTATSDLQNIVQTIAHEFAHQWFGNLISPKWWQYVWLNEGFANFFQSLITEKVNPEWRSIDQSVVSSIQTTAFNADSKDSKPLNHNVNSPEEISNKFDSISYQKGGAVIRMMQHFLTEKIFQEGIQNYLQKNQFKAADSDDLFSALQEIVDKNNFTLPDKVKEIMNSWVNSPGYPVITVNRASDDKIKIKQERFITYKNEHGNDVSNTWHIPINYVVGSKPDFTETLASEWLTGAEKEITVKAHANEWIILNKQQTGYYRVDYDEKSWELIIKHLNSADEAEIKKIHVLNRAQLTNDALALAQQGKLKLRSLLDLIAYLKNETDYIAWNPGFKTISWLNEKLANTDYYPELKSFLLDKFSKIMNKTGLEETKEDDHLTKLNRKTVVDWACYLGDKGCTDKMNSRLGAWLNDSTKNPISEDMKKITLCHGLRLADENTWYRVFNKTLITTDETEKNQLIEGMTCTNDKKLLEYLLNYTLENNSVYNDTLAVVKSVRDNSNIGVDTVIDFVTSRTTRILIKYEKKERLTEFLRAILEKISIEAQLQQFLKAIDEDIPDVIIADAKASAEANINWLKNNSATLQSWVEDVHKTQKDNGAGMISASLGLVLSLLLIAFNNMK